MTAIFPSMRSVLFAFAGISMLLLTACGKKFDDVNFDYYGKLSIMLAFNGDTLFFLETDDGAEYQLEFGKKTQYSNIEEGEYLDEYIWAPGQYHGVYGKPKDDENPKVILIKRIVLIVDNAEPSE
ncbi:hypothetical protein MNBD_ALPHA05-220 [hydrothermal vent metagenome]|uniref:Lipoprotein n=1 Tax=hydrothermal vent metagenome TaxID=652676 RepID=A0A3B0T3S3_9ZZZZ